MISKTYQSIPKIMRMVVASSKMCSVQKELINVPPPKYAEHRK